MLNHFGKLFVVTALAASLTGCGGKSGSATPGGKATKAFMGSTSGTSSFSSQQARQARALALKVYERAQHLATTAQFANSRGNRPMSDACSGFSMSDAGGSGATCTTPTCTSTGEGTTNMSISYSQTCTAASSTGTCKDVTFTATDLSADVAFDLTLDSTTGSGSVVIKEDMNIGSVSASDNSFSGKVACKFGFKQSFSASSSSSSEPSCADVDFSCTVGGETLSCQDLVASSNSCS
ncbi:MAG: hypothetical protein JST16_06190 [Bdellovibrionales bacterium]|nr:hypothetical protein [Bdellovibrionales bacterium]